MKHTQTWTDVYGSACASFEGRAGGHTWLVAAPPELAAGVPAALEALDGKGTVELLVHDGVTPLLSTARELRPKGVVIVAAQELASGPAVTLTAQTISLEGGIEYIDGGEFPAWHSAVGGRGKVGECAAASAAASVGCSVMVTDTAGLLRTVEHWMDMTPHGR